MSDPIHKALTASIAALLRPLVRLLLRHGVAYGSFAEIAKRVYVEVAEKDFALDDRKQTNSRIAVLTGLTRKDVLRIMRSEDQVEDDAQHHRASRVISGWQHDAEFQTVSGKPADLPMDGETGSFAALVARYSGDMPVRAMADELQRVGAVNVEAGGALRLLVTAYVPTKSSPESLAIFGGDVADLLATIDYNIDPLHTDTRFQLKTYYDNVPIEAAEAFCHWADPQSMELIRRFDSWLAQHDRDNNPEVTGSGRSRVGVGIYLFRDDAKQDGEES